MNIGFHIGLLKTFEETLRYHHQKSGGIRSFQLFTKNPRQTQIKKINEEDAKKCKEYVEREGIFLVTHASYLLNMSNSENKISNSRTQFIIIDSFTSRIDFNICF
jgi:endonuclease IV